MKVHTVDESQFAPGKPGTLHHFKLKLGEHGSECELYMDGELVHEAISFTVEAQADKYSIVTLKMFAHNVEVEGDAYLADDGDEVIEHNYGPGQPGTLRHFKRNSKGCLLCDPAAESRERKLSD